MPALFIFLFKVNIALVLFCIGYYLVLRHLTFYTINRIYLVTAILFSTVYPFININNFLQRHQQLAAPVQKVILQWKTPAENFVIPLNQPNYWQWAEVVFWAGAVLFALRLGMQLFSLYKLYRRSTPGHVNNYPVRLIDGDVSPFSFWRSIFVNPTMLAPNDLAKVLEHEQVHVSQWHTLDILLAELSTVFYWFNPGVWLMKKAVRENIEFITDRKILEKGIDSKQYQYSLLNVSMAGTPNTIVNNFNISTIKKRIIMMNTKRSSRIKLSTYVLIAPIVVALLLIFSISKADIAKKGIVSIKSSLSAAIKSVAISGDDRPIKHPVVQKEKTVPVVRVKVKPETNLIDTIYAGKSKNGRKNMLITSDKSVDSVELVVNGAKASREEVKALNPDKVKSLDMVPVADARQFVDFMLDKPEVLFITTNDSEKGKYLKERLDNAMGGGTLAHARNMASAATVESSDVAPAAASSASGVSGSSSTSSSDVAPEVTVYTKNVSGSEAAAVKVEGYAKSAVRNKVYVTSSANTIVTANGTYTIAPKVADKVYITGKDKKSTGITYVVRDATAESGTEPLIVVDGKTVQSIKKVDSDDIESIVVLKDKHAKDTYGEKGKNGVIVITTKKGKK